MNSIKRVLLLLPFIFLFNNCKEKPIEKEGEKNSAKLSLEKLFSKDFKIGAAINDQQIAAQDTAAIRLLQGEFNSITPENIMKWEEIHPVPDTFNFGLSDTYVALGEKYGMNIIGHTLLWHSQIGPWMNEVKDSTVMADYIEQHINTVAGRYKGRINGWDVVNEALNEDGSLRESNFLKVMGERYLEHAFKLAAKADPEAELYYNDYNMWKPEKRKGAIKLIKQLQANGAKIDGVGMQAHWSIEGPPLQEIENSIIAYAELGIKVMFTELDITVLPNPWDLNGAAVEQNYERFEGDPKMNPYPNGMPDSVKTKLSNRYQDIFKLFLKHKDKISRVTFWGVSDGNSWLNNWPINGRTNYPLLFDREYRSKKAHQAILDLKSSE
ncbi:endo-1,4-beta-xylanase [Maribacter sp.]|nr:endo-1,4-beta-xylanase [Maribacter sp.]